MLKFMAACAQFAITPLAVRENVQKAVYWIERAVRENEAQLVVLPETVTTGFVPALSPEELWDRVDVIPGALTAPIAEAARRLGVLVVFSTYERGEARGTVYNSSALFNRQGEL